MGPKAPPPRSLADTILKDDDGNFYIDFRLEAWTGLFERDVES